MFSPRAPLKIAMQGWCATLILVACTGSPASPPEAAIVVAARELVDAAPADWPAHVERITRRRDPNATVALIDAATRRPHALGAECAVALANELGTGVTTTALEALLDAPPSVAARAAMALGKCEPDAAHRSLLAAMNRHDLDPLVRTAAAATLLDLGDRRVAPRFLAAILLAGSPAGEATRDRAGLPDKTRWAHERTLAVDAIRRATNGIDFGLHPDAPWPELAAGTERMLEALERS